MFGATETPYDLRFRALGIPVRVHPLFWVIMAIIGWEPENLPVVLIFVGCAFLSILVHEYGHGLTAMRNGAPASIVLWGMGGLCYNDTSRQTPGQRLAVIAAGPGAGFLLCGVTMMTYSALFGLTFSDHLAFITQLARQPSEIGPGLRKLEYGLHAFNPRFEIYWDLVQINIVWGVLNILPIWPLDGGRICEIVLTRFSPYQGRRWTHVISLLASGLLAVAIFTYTHSLFSTIFFGYFAFMNYQMLDSIHRAQTMGIYDDDSGR